MLIVEDIDYNKLKKIGFKDFKTKTYICDYCFLNIEKYYIKPYRKYQHPITDKYYYNCDISVLINKTTGKIEFIDELYENHIGDEFYLKTLYDLFTNFKIKYKKEK